MVEAFCHLQIRCIVVIYRCLWPSKCTKFLDLFCRTLQKLPTTQRWEKVVFYAFVYLFFLHTTSLTIFRKYIYIYIKKPFVLTWFWLCFVLSIHVDRKYSDKSFERRVWSFMGWRDSNILSQYLKNKCSSQISLPKKGLFYHSIQFLTSSKSDESLSSRSTKRIQNFDKDREINKLIYLFV